MTTTDTPAPDLAEVKQRQQKMWASGDFHAVATQIQPIADELCQAVDLQAGWRVIDVACGSGNAAIAAARCDSDVVGIDYVPSLLARGRRRAEAEGVNDPPARGRRRDDPVPGRQLRRSPVGLRRDVRAEPPAGRRGADARLPPRRQDRPRDLEAGRLHRRAAEGVAAHVPPPPGVASPILWGTEPYLRELFGAEIDELVCTERTFTWRARSAEAFVDLFRTYYGPTLKAFEAVGDTGADALYSDLIDLVERYAGTSTGPLTIPATWLEVVAIRSTEVAAARA